jgi:hypothetical protein
VRWRVFSGFRGDIRQALAKRVTANSIRLHIGGIRAFSKFLRLTGLAARAKFETLKAETAGFSTHPARP